MILRFASWNVNGRNPKPSHLELLRSLRIDVLALQEATASFHSALGEEAFMDWGASSLALRPPLPGDGRNRRLGCSIFGRAHIQFLGSALIDGLPLPERAISAHAQIGGLPLTLCSFHAPPGANWKSVKPRSIRRFAEWLASNTDPTIVGMDANTPKVDHPEHDQNEWWWEDDEPALLGPTPVHPLRDTLRVWLADQPERLARIRAERTDGPLAISHIRGRSATKTPVRYDFVYATPSFRPISIDYLYDEALRAGSDHALVIAELEHIPGN